MIKEEVLVLKRESEGNPNNYYPPLVETDERVLDKLLEIAQKHHTLKVFKYIVIHNREEDKNKPLKFYQDFYSSYFIPESEYHDYKWKDHLIKEPKIFYPYTYETWLKVYLQ